MRVVVIGAGLAGLAAALHLRGRGYEVTVVEREPGPGGRASTIERDGFTFDTGPTVMTMPDLVADALAAVGADLSAYIPMRRLDPGYRAVYHDGSEIFVRAGHEAMKAEIARVSGARDAAAFDGFVDWARRLYEVEMPHFIDHNFDSVADLVAAPGAAARLVRLGAFGRLGPAVGKWFEDERLHRIFSFQALYAGLAPAKALAVYAVITYMDSVAGVWFHEGGMSALPRGMAAAAADAGVEFAYDAPVEELLRDRSGRVAGVRLGPSGERIPADAVVCTLDLPVAYERLLPGLRAPWAARRGVYSPSCVLWHVGVRGRPDESIRHHNIHFGADWDGAFTALIDDGRIMPDPSRLVSVPSLTAPELAPPGDSTLYVLEPVPNLDGRVDWRTERPRARDRLAEFLADNGYPTDIVTEEFVDPLDWQAQGMARGTPFALAHLFRQTGPFRPGNVDRRVPGLVFAGSGTVPGVGVPMVLISGKLAAQRVGQYVSAPAGRPR